MAAELMNDEHLDAELIQEHLQVIEAVKYLVFCVCRILKAGDSDESSIDDVVPRVKDFLRMIPTDNKDKSMEYLQIFKNLAAPRALFLLFKSPIKRNKEIGEESIRLFLNPEIGRCLPRSVQNQCALIVSEFCSILNHGPLYNSCRETLGSLLKSIGFANRSRYFGNVKPSDLIELFFPYVRELSLSLFEGLYSITTSSSLSTSFELSLSFGSDIREFALFSLHLRRAIEDHFKSKGQSLPVCLDDNFHEHPCYLKSIVEFYSIFDDLVKLINPCMNWMFTSIRIAGRGWEFNHGWSYYLSVLKELDIISKLFQGAEEYLLSEMQSYKLQLDMLIWFSKRSSDDHQWLLKHKNVIDFESRTNLIMMMFPEVKQGGEDENKLHKVLIDRSQLLTESFENIAHANPKSLHSGLFIEFKNEVATGNGVLREWLVLVCQALFNPENSLFLACPYDRRRFFPNPATNIDVDPRHLTYYRFCGRVIALALMHNIQVGIAFDLVFFLKLAGEGISLEDVRYADPIMYNSCKKILEMDVDFMDSDAMGLTFVTEIEESEAGFRKVVELCPGGNTIVVNSKNREEYVHLLIQHCFVKSIAKKVAYFARGFGDILCKRKLQKIFFRSIELKDLDRMLLGSDKAICVTDWKAHTDYDDYKETDDQICWFWKVVEGMSSEQQRELLFFWTSVKYLPVDGFSGLPSRLYIYKTSGSHHRLPSSHTCFYRLALPHYPSLAVMQQHLFLICQEHVGCSFGDD
ncbi:HECT [Macleaya cordata]|uniref:HECT-type E3 ubiquitin transferase n=1 Tax=Macleaya cordata TaxID=56857 RepID=A0A200QL20_MACCD|nr:HECT [Macleaya cordata]